MRTDHLVWLASTLRYHALEFLQDELRNAGVRDLIPSQGALLSSLYGRGGRASMKTLVDASGKRKSTMTELANALERRGYLAREPDPEDARGVILALTDKALALRDTFDEISARLIERAWGDMPVEDRETLVRLIERTIANMKTPDLGQGGP